MKKTSLIAAIVLALSPFIIGALVLNFQNKNDSSQSYDEKVYVAIETEGRVGVIDAQSKKMIKSIDLSEVQNSRFVKYTIHNIQVSPDGQKVIATANVDRGAMGERNRTSEDVTDGLSDKIFVIDPLTDSILYSIPLEINAHLAHVVVNKSGNLAYVASQEKGKVYKIDLEAKRIIDNVDIGKNSQPHGLRLSADGSKIFVALIEGKAIAAINTSDNSIQNFPMSGSVIQTAVTPDGQYVFGSVYDTKKVAWIDLSTNEGGYIDLPEDAKGSVQLYTTPDSKYIYVVNQGYYFDQPTGSNVYRIDINQKKVDQTIAAGDAPHGVVVDKLGKFVYVTNLLSEDVSVIDTATNKEVARIKVGVMPNGISIWNKKLGGTP